MWLLLIAAYGVMLQPLAMPPLEACKALEEKRLVKKSGKGGD
jgi:hypothetical protein